MFDHSQNNSNGQEKQVWQALTQDDFANVGMPSLVYVKAVKARDIMDELGEAAQDAGFKPEQVVYSVHAANGTRMAVVDSRDAAFAGAVQYDFQPVSVH